MYIVFSVMVFLFSDFSVVYLLRVLCICVSNLGHEKRHFVPMCSVCGVIDGLTFCCRLRFKQASTHTQNVNSQIRRSHQFWQMSDEYRYNQSRSKMGVAETIFWAKQMWAKCVKIITLCVLIVLSTWFTLDANCRCRTIQLMDESRETPAQLHYHPEYHCICMSNWKWSNRIITTATSSLHCRLCSCWRYYECRVLI